MVISRNSKTWSKGWKLSHPIKSIASNPIRPATARCTLACRRIRDVPTSMLAPYFDSEAPTTMWTMAEQRVVGWFPLVSASLRSDPTGFLLQRTPISQCLQQPGHALSVTHSLKLWERILIDGMQSLSRSEGEGARSLKANVHWRTH
jgi:hypothetical protein